MPNHRARALAGLLALACAAAAHAQSVRISQIFGGGGGSLAPYNHDFIELFNAGQAPVAMAGWSVQYASSTGAIWQVTSIPAFTLAPGQYFLIAEGSAGANGLDLPAADAAGTIGLSQSNGKVALVTSTTPLSGACPTNAQILDFVGYGTANCAEGLAVGSLSNLTAAVRNNDGCADTNVNRADFTITGDFLPRNSASPLNVCPPEMLCKVDFNGDGYLDPDDLADFISCYFAATPCEKADFNQDMNVDPDDLADFIAGYFQGCP